MKILIALWFSLMALTSIAQPYASSNFTLISKIDPETVFNSDGDKYSACWGWYQASKKKEYAIAGAQGGTYWVDITNPATPTVSAYRSATHAGAIWREIKTYQNYCYVISDDSGNNSFQIFDMSYLPDSVKKVYDSKALFSRGHTLWVDGNKLYVASVTYSNNNYSSMNVYSLATPSVPTLIRSLNQDYPFITGVHDMYVRNDTIYASCQYQGLFVFKLTAANTFTQLGSLTTYTASGYNHSSALTPNGKTLVFTDEVPNGLPLKIANVSNLGNIQVQSTINQFSLTTPHNPFVVTNTLCFMSSYVDGLQLFNISSPATPSLVGYFDTYPQGGGNTGNWSNGYDGQWGCYPFFPSKTIFALDQLNGIFLLKTNLYANVTQTVSTIGMAENTSMQELQVFPNPSNETVMVYLPAGQTALSQNISVLSADGAEQPITIRAQTDGYSYEIDLHAIPNGIYALRINSEEKNTAVKKLVISR
jgi:choice-of-anchor B domain-containing protein